MCGIIGRVGRDDVTGQLLTGLENLEYRGYDSAGIAINNGHGLNVVKREGEVDELVRAVERSDPGGSIGIGHTRWSTHGAPSDRNAHPHTDCTGRVAVVHNGIIDNHEALKGALPDHEFTSETDSEVVAHLLEKELSEGREPVDAFRRTRDRLSGSYALVGMIDGQKEMYAARNGSPLVIGRDDDGYYLASDVPAFREFTDEVVYLEDDDLVAVSRDGYTVWDGTGSTVDREVHRVDWKPEAAGRGGYDHYMLKEIHEQPNAIRSSIRGRTDALAGKTTFEELEEGSFEEVDRVQLIAMGTSYHAALYAERLLERRGIPAQTFLSGEYGASPPPVDGNTLVVAVSQSGETADTLSAVRSVQGTRARTLAVTNVVGSTITRECDDVVYIRAGPEIGVAATKSFSSQVGVLSLLSELIAAESPGSGHRNPALLDAVTELPGAIQQVLDDSNAAEVASDLQGSDAYFFIGRGTGHAVALEGALKFKEITYEHAEGFAASELKHGPLALVTENTPVFAVFTGVDDEKTLHNVMEVRARGAPVVGVTQSTPSVDGIEDYVDHVLTVPPSDPELSGLLANVQLQLVSYHAADLLSRSIDKPRNLAKSVTVE
ncbi:MAG: glutamine--fructose-6-phosphate transaminase (isomerizing) [Haloferacaceae archaeon]